MNGLTVFILLVCALFAHTTTSHRLNPLISNHDITVIINETTDINFGIRGIINEPFLIEFVASHPNLIEIYPSELEILPSNRSYFNGINNNNNNNNSKNNDHYQIKNYLISVKGINPGLLDVTTTTIPTNIDMGNMFFRITIAISPTIIYISIFVGWLYFMAWSASFYPQIYDNYQRKSVVGLNFDYLSFNLVGFVMYGVFNVGLFWNPTIQKEYFSRYPTGLNPVLLNDVFFSLNALLATIITVTQCFIYERSKQRVSTVARIILTTFLVIVLVIMKFGITGEIHWLDFLYYCSYIKLSITLIKYIPQAVMNYRRKSTVGWSIGCIFLDIIGGVFSILQMILNAYNHSDWASIFGDPTKFGLGLFSICFDIFFIFQHYVLYREPRTTGLRENDSNLDRLLTEKA